MRRFLLAALAIPLALPAAAASASRKGWTPAATPSATPAAASTDAPVVPDPPFVENTRATTRPPSAEALVFQSYKPALATVTAARPTDRGGQSQGTAFVLHASGLLLTSHHVIAEADEITVRFADGEPMTARLAGADPALDLAILRVDPRGDHPMATAVLGDSDLAREGDPVVALGMPLGLGATITRGILSGKDRKVDVGTVGLAGRPVAFLQTDAAINPGSSGGPICDLDGRVLGVTTATIPGAKGVSFAIPINAVKAALPRILKEGSLGHAWLGLTLGPASGAGAEVVGVRHGGPADRAGIMTGDIVTAIRGRSINTDTDVVESMRDVVPHETIPMAFRRHGKVARVDLTATEVPVKPVVESLFLAGALLSEFTPDSPASVTAGRHFAGTGVFFDSVPKDSPAAKSGISEGDALLVIGIDAVSDLDDVRVLLDRDLSTDEVKIVVRHDQKTRTVIVPR
ncbi:MAG TPA: trypsin-like peptidase domain-containing protein [bacterium]|nr:trypsin-like peptidase domain-containing protein [bacterium]